MLVAQISWQSRDATRPTISLIRIANVGGGRIANYEVHALDASGAILGTSEISSYPRWSEPVSGLVARGIASVKSLDDAFDGELAVEGATVETSIHPARQMSRARSLATMTVTVTGDAVAAELEEHPIPSTACDFQLASACTRPLELLRAAFAHLLWSRCDLPPVPATSPVLPLIADGGREYVRSHDIPPWAAHAFRQYARGFELALPGVRTPCFDARLWQRFLGPE